MVLCSLQPLVSASFQKPAAQIFMSTKTTCFEVFEKCVQAVQAGELIESANKKDKEFHFQNWFEQRLRMLAVHFDPPRRNAYPDFSLVEYAEGYEVKGLAWPGRERDYDSNSQIPVWLSSWASDILCFRTLSCRSSGPSRYRQWPQSIPHHRSRDLPRRFSQR